MADLVDSAWAHRVDIFQFHSTYHQKVKYLERIHWNQFFPYNQASNHFMMRDKVVEEDLSNIWYFVKNQLTLDFTRFFTINRMDFYLSAKLIPPQSRSKEVFCSAWPCEHSQRVKSCSRCPWKPEFTILIFVLYRKYLSKTKFLHINYIFPKKSSTGQESKL